MAPSPLVQQRRDAEFKAARTRAEVDILHRRWATEDGAADLAESALAREVSDLRRRAAKLETTLAAVIEAANKNMASVDKDLDGIIKAIDGLCAGVEAVKATVPRFCGVHAAARTYEPNSLVVKNGSLWISLVKTTQGPGTTDWQLCTKQGDVR
jgi:uncharacterized protein (DUF885 family)